MRDKKRVLHYSESILREKNGSPFSVSPFPSFGASNFPQKNWWRSGSPNGAPYMVDCPGYVLFLRRNFEVIRFEKCWKMLVICNDGSWWAWNTYQSLGNPFQVPDVQLLSRWRHGYLPVELRSNKSNMTSLVLFVSFPVDAIFVDS